MMQPDLFAPTGYVVDPLGHVCPRDYPTELMTYGQRALISWRANASTPLAWIELACHTDGRWMWSASVSTIHGGQSYRVGPKWGKFAADRLAALLAASQEMLQIVSGRMSLPGLTPAGVRKWLDDLQVAQP